MTPSQHTVEQIDAPLVTDFLNDLEQRRGNRPSSRNVRLAAIKSFMHFLEYRLPAALEQIRRILAIPTKQTESRLVRHLTIEEMQAILDAPNPTTWGGVRDRAMLHLCYAGGLRVSELIGVTLDDLTFQPQPTVLNPRQGSSGTVFAALENDRHGRARVDGHQGNRTRPGALRERAPRRAYPRRRRIHPP